MKTHTITTYSFNELSEPAKEKAINRFRGINTNGDWWDSVYQDFQMLCATLGIDVDLKNTFFQGFYSQGDGSSFTSTVNVLDFIKGIRLELWKNHAPQETFDFLKVFLSVNVENALKNIAKDKGNQTFRVTTGQGAGYCGDCRLSVNIEYYDEIFDDLATTIKHNLQLLNQWLYKQLETEHDSLTSDEMVEESIVANDYQFTEDGEFFHE